MAIGELSFELHEKAPPAAPQPKVHHDAPDHDPMANPWDAWRSQQAPELFEVEVTHRG